MVTMSGFLVSWAPRDVAGAPLLRHSGRHMAASHGDLLGASRGAGEAGRASICGSVDGIAFIDFVVFIC